MTGHSLAEEVEENAQDGVEVENRDFAIDDDPLTPYHEAQIGSPSAIAFQDNGVYNIGVRPTNEDIMRGGNDVFGWPLSLAALAMKNLAGRDYEPCDTPGDPGALSSNEPPVFLGGPCGDMSNFDPSMGPGGGLFEETGADQRINPGLEMEPASPLLPEYLAPWANNLPAGEASPQIDELAFAPNTITEAPFAEFGEFLFGSDFNCGTYDPDAFGAGPPNFGWGPRCPNSQTGVPVNFDPPLNGTWPFANRVARNGAVKAPQLRNVELTGPYFHTGSYLTLRQVVDFYMRGGDFPITNKEDRDPNIVDVGVQAFGFGTTIGLPPEFQDGIPDTISQYGPMPDTGHPSTPEPRNCDTGGGESRPCEVPHRPHRQAGEVRTGALRPSRDVRPSGRPGSGQYDGPRRPHEPRRRSRDGYGAPAAHPYVQAHPGSGRGRSRDSSAELPGCFEHSSRWQQQRSLRSSLACEPSRLAVRLCSFPPHRRGGMSNVMRERYEKTHTRS